MNRLKGLLKCFALEKEPTEVRAFESKVFIHSFSATKHKETRRGVTEASESSSMTACLGQLQTLCPADLEEKELKRFLIDFQGGTI